MAEKTKRSITIAAPADRVMAAVIPSADTPLDAGIVKDTYVLRYTWAPDGRSVSWELESGEIQKAQSGSYVLSDAADGGTTVDYELTVDLTIPMIGLFKRKAEKVITDTALKELKKQVEG